MIRPSRFLEKLRVALFLTIEIYDYSYHHKIKRATNLFYNIGIRLRWRYR